jgi:hypothetical protein
MGVGMNTTTVMPVMPTQGNGRATTAAKGQGRNGNGGHDMGVVQGVSVVAGEIAGKSLGAFLGATVYDDDLNPYHHVTKVYLNHGGEIGIDGKQHITPWFFNPLLSSHGEDQHKRCVFCYTVYVIPSLLFLFVMSLSLDLLVPAYIP